MFFVSRYIFFQIIFVWILLTSSFQYENQTVVLKGNDTAKRDVFYKQSIKHLVQKSKSFLLSESVQPSAQPSSQPSIQPSRQQTSMPTSHVYYFGPAGALQTFTVPASAQWILVDVQGGAGGGMNTPELRGGYGARVQALLPVTGGTVLNIFVGGLGTQNIGGLNGGGNGGGAQATGGGGGSDIRIGGTALSNRVVVAGGGGGIYTGTNCGLQKGGHGGQNGLPGTNGCGAGGGGGGTQSAGGTPSLPASPGALGVGGAGALNANAGGGGGGYYGGKSLRNVLDCFL
jgi:hypothetical protein